MRETSKTLSLPVGEETLTFRIRKLDAFSGARLLKLLSSFQDRTPSDASATLTDLLFSLPDEELERLMKTCLAHADVSLPAGYAPVFSEDCWALPELEYETVPCLRLTQEVMNFALAGFFPEKGPA